MVCWKHGHYVLLSGFYHDNLRVVSTFYVLGLSDSLRGNGFRMMQNLVADFAFVQTIDELFWYFQERPPMQTITFLRDLYFPEAREQPRRA